MVWVSINQKLSEKFIEKFQNKLDWYWVSKYQKLSEKFLYKNLDKISIKELKENEHLNFSNEFYDSLESIKKLVE